MGPDFEAKRTFFSRLFSQNYLNISMNPRCWLCGDSKLALWPSAPTVISRYSL
jgi:hypothetical protein